jgi:hypothetical protein
MIFVCEFECEPVAQGGFAALRPFEAGQNAQSGNKYWAIFKTKLRC